MKSQPESSSSSQQSPFALNYEPVETEGECILISIVPIQKQKLQHSIFTVVAVLMMGLPFVFTYWYPKLKVRLYFRECTVAECSHFQILNYDKQVTIVQKKQQKNQVSSINSLKTQPSPISVYFVNRYMKYRVNETTTIFTVRADTYNYDQKIKKIVNQNYKNHQKIVGNDQTSAEQLKKRFGPGTMIIQRPGLGVLFIRQIVRPLYFFIIFTLVVWLYESYYYYCLVIFVTTAVGIVINLYQTYTLNNKIFQMAYYDTQVNILRNGKIINMSSKDVVPGDIVFLHDPIKMPFDGVILQGSALMNQCALTGESVPVVRKAENLQELDTFYSNVPNYSISLKNNLVCEGTTIVQVDNKKKMYIFEQYRKQYGVPVFVIRTNFITVKGQLIRIISFPIQKTNIFQKQSSLFLIFLFCLSITSYAALIIRLAKYVRVQDLVIKFLDLITITVPPGLPVSMTFGIIYAIDKLKKKQIFCVSPSKVVMGGLVDLICFDKTGTLTEDFMDFKSLVPAFKGSFQPTIQNNSQYKSVTELTDQPYIEHILFNMASNHTIVSIESTKQNIGDPMQVKLFQFGGFSFNDGIMLSSRSSNGREKNQLENVLFGFDNQKGHQGNVVRMFQFDSELLRMSVVCKHTGKDKQNQGYFVYVKGSPQSIQKISQFQTLPKDYAQVLKRYASLGFRVLGIGHKKIKESQLNFERAELQNYIEFDGFEVFENCLKPETKSAISELKHAKIPCVMITGDNPLTGSNMAYKSGIADKRKKMFIFDYNQYQNIFKSEQFVYEVDKNEKYEDYQNFEEQFEQIQNSVQLPQINQTNNYQDESFVQNSIAKIQAAINPKTTQLCLTGSAFNLLFGNIKLEQMDEQRKNILKWAKVYARAKPNDKARIVMAYQQGLNKIVSMCGDGANDCGALKQSDAGLSLSQTQASISAPFTSKVANISSMVELIKQCRAGLVTNFALFNIMAMYSLIQYSSAVICQYFFTYPADMNFLYWDIFCNFFFFITFGYTGTADTLSSQKPSKSLLSVTNLMQIVFMYLTQLSGQLLMIFSISHFFTQQIQYEVKGGSDNNYKSYVENDNSFLTSSPQTNVIFLFTNFMYIFSFIAFSISKPWRKQFFTNIPFMIVFAFSFTYSVLLVILPSSRLSIFSINFMSNNLVNLYVLMVALIYGMFMYFCQKCLLQPLSAKIRQKYPTKGWL